MNKSGRFRFVAGFLCGALLFGGVTAFAASVVANPKTAKVIIDGKEVDLKGYIIEGSHYFQLRDLDEKLKPGGKDFSVVWDGAGNRVIIDTGRGYDANEQYQAPAPAPSAGTVPAAHDVKFSPLRKGDTVKTEAVPKWKSTIGGDYKITKDCFDVEAERNKAGVNFSDLAYGAALPAWKAEWNGFPATLVKDPETAHYKSGQNDRLDVYNAYEAERMVRAIYTYANAYAYLWKDEARTIPNFKIVSEFPSDNQGWFFPWRGGISVEGKVKSLSAGGTIHIYALDVYYNGEFKDTEYWCWK
jgi:hypothetical protein